ASARSASRSACSQARLETASRTAAGTKIASKRPSDGKERRLTLALQADVEAESVDVTARDEGRACRLAELGEDRIRRVRLLLLREVDARREPLQEPAGEHGDREMRGLQPAVRPVDAARLHGHEVEAPVGVRAATAKTAPRRVAALRVRAPDLEHA